MIDVTTVARRMARLEYAVVRRPFTLFDDRVVARCWEEDAIVRVGFERFLGSLDWLAGRLLADGTISARGRALLRQDGFPAAAGAPGPEARTRRPREDRQAQEAWAAWERAQPWYAPEQEGAGRAPEQAGAGRAPEQAEEAAHGRAAAHREPEDEQHGHGEAGAPAAADEPPAEGTAGDRAAGQPGAPAAPAAGAGTVDVTFTLPAEVRAETVALCGDFNDWSVQSLMLDRGSDGSWRATVALEPGRSYRYRYLLDGKRWENAWHADCYLPNSFGGTDSVVVVQ